MGLTFTQSKVQHRIQNTENKHKYTTQKPKAGKIQYKTLNEENVPAKNPRCGSGRKSSFPQYHRQMQMYSFATETQDSSFSLTANTGRARNEFFYSSVLRNVKCLFLCSDFFNPNQDINQGRYVRDTTEQSSCLLGYPVLHDRVHTPTSKLVTGTESRSVRASGVPRNFVRREGGQQIQLRTKDRKKGYLGAVATKSGVLEAAVICYKKFHFIK